MKKLLAALVLSLSSYAYAGVNAVITLPGGRDKAVQYNSNGVFVGTSTFRFYPSSASLFVPNVQVSSITFRDGSSISSFLTNPSGGPAGSNGQVQVNNGGDFGAAVGITYGTANGALAIGGAGAGANSADTTFLDNSGSVLHRITSLSNGVQFNVDSSARPVSFNKGLVTISSNVISASSAAITNVNVTNLKFNDGTTQTSASTGGSGGADSFGSHIATKTITAGFGILCTTGVFTSTLTVSGSTVVIGGLTYKYPTSASGANLIQLYNATTSTLAWTAAITDAAQLGSAQSFTNKNTFTGNTVLEASTTVKAVAEPGTPASGYGVLYLRNSDSTLYFKTADGTAHDLFAGASGGGDSFGSHIATKTVTMGYGFTATTAAFSSDVTFANVSTVTYGAGSKLDVSAAALRVPSGTSPPATCQIGDFFMDTDATTGQRLYACESANTWVLEGGSGSGGADSFGSHIATKTVTMGYGYTATTATLSDLATFNSTATFNSQVLNNNVSTVTYASTYLRLTGTSKIEWPDGTIQVSSGTGGGGGGGDITDVTAGYGLTGGGTTGAVTLNLANNSTSYIRNTSTLQSSAAYYVSSGSVDLGMIVNNTNQDVPGVESNGTVNYAPFKGNIHGIGLSFPGAPLLTVSVCPSGTCANQTAIYYTDSSAGIYADGLVMGNSSVLFPNSPLTKGAIVIPSTASIRWGDANASNYVALRASDTVASNVTWTLPAADGTNGQVLATKGNGNLYWDNTAAGGAISVTSIAFPDGTIQTSSAPTTGGGGATVVSSYTAVVSSFSTTSAGAQNAPGFSFSIGANETWSFEFVLYNGCDNTGGNKFAITVPSGASFRSVAYGKSSSTTAVRSERIEVSGTLSGAFNAEANSNGWTNISGSVTNGATPGTVQLQYASTTSTQTTTIHVGSHMNARRTAP